MHLSSIWSPAKFSENRTPTFGHFGVVSHEDHCWGGPEWPPVHPEKALTSTDSDSDAGFILIYGILLGFLPKFRGTQKKSMRFSQKMNKHQSLNLVKKNWGHWALVFRRSPPWPRPQSLSFQRKLTAADQLLAVGSKKGCLMRTCNGHFMVISWWFHGDLVVISNGEFMVI